MTPTVKSPVSKKQMIKSAEAQKKKELSHHEMDLMADRAVVSLFNALSSAIRKSPLRSFAFPLKRKLADCRRIANTWVPQSYDSGQAIAEFDVPYVLGNFFNRYISTDEMSSSKQLEAKAAKKFLETNFDGWSIDSYALNHPCMLPLINKMRRIIGEVIPVFQVTDIYTKAKHGPNSTTNVSLSDAYIHIKNGDISGNRASLQQFVHYLSWDQPLRELLIDLKPGIREYLNTTVLFSDIPGIDVARFTRTSFVPKKFDSLRTMNPEATIPAYFSQGVALGLTEVLQLVNIDLRTQPLVHRRLAYLGSFYPHLQIATIDWSEASDRIWMILAEEVFTEGNAPSWIRFIKNVCRLGCSQVKFSGSFGDGQLFSTYESLIDFLEMHVDEFKVKLTHKKQRYSVVATVETSMVATMGNPVTFPLQTLIFYSFLTACSELAAERIQQETGEYPDLQPVSSFGDDGIVDSRAVSEVRHYADLLAWRLNVGKSYSEGGFRESCGGDYYDGRYCRPFEPKRPPLTSKMDERELKLTYQAWLYICANNIAPIIEQLGGDLTYLDTWLKEQHSVARLGKVCVVPPSYPDGSGLRVQWWGEETDLRQLFDTFKCANVRGSPLMFPGFDGPGELPSWYHSVSFKLKEQAFEFYALTSRPDKLELTEEDSQHYFHLVLKHRCSLGSLSREVQKFHRPSFFDVHKELEVMDQDGNISRKQCKLYKAKHTATLWQ